MSNLEIFTKQGEYLYAHIREDKVPEKLEEHLALSLKYWSKITHDKQLNKVWEGFKDKLGGYPEFEEMLEQAIYLHDIGKININFQLKRMQNQYFHMPCGAYSDHSLLSALIYLDYYYKTAKKEQVTKEQLPKLQMLMILNAYVISRHHTHLSSLEDFEREILKLVHIIEADKQVVKVLYEPIEITEKQIKFWMKNVKRYMQQTYKGWENTTPYIYTKFLYSIMIACDFYATSEYMNDDVLNDIGILDNIEEWERAYKETNIYKGIKSYIEKRENICLEYTKNINYLRSEMFFEATQNLKDLPENKIYYLEAPTGSGKTNTSIWLALNLLNSQKSLNKVMYIFPFNTLAEQTYHSLSNIFFKSKTVQQMITVVNSITPIKNKQEEEIEELDYEQMLLDRQFLHYPLVITSHVQLFNLLFGTKREQMGALYQVANSVIILDEIQSYKNTLWAEMIGFLKQYADLLGIKIIMMSATLPRLGELINEEEIMPLIRERKKYFSHPVFKQRVVIDYKLLQQEEPLEAMTREILLLTREKEQKILIEFIKKKSAISYYNELLERQEMGQLKIPIRLITGDDSKWEREACIREIKEQTNIILIATQLIEAGVDIDMDIGFKDISLLDSEEQFLGRINRSCLKTGCKAYLFNLDEAGMIYKKDYRKQKKYTLLEEENRKILKEKTFDQYYKPIMQDLIRYGEQQNGNNLIQFLEEKVGLLQAEAVASHMRLIDEDLYPDSVFLGRDIEVIKDNQVLTLKGEEIWETYVTIIKDKEMSYPEKKVKLSNLREWMSCFIWKVKKCNISYNERIGDLYYIEEGEQFFTNGKFDREKLSGDSFELI